MFRQCLFSGKIYIVSKRGQCTFNQIVFMIFFVSNVICIVTVKSVYDLLFLKCNM